MNVQMMCTQMDFIFWKGRTEIFLHLKFLYENEYKAFHIFRETEIRSSVLLKCSIKEAF